MKDFATYINEKLDFKFEHDIEKKFEYLNNLLFNNELTLPPYSFDMNKNRSAWVSNISYKQRNRVISIKDITLHFSKNCVLTEEQFKNTLAHEMIHLWLYYKKIYNDYGGDHGIIFTREMDRINNMNADIKISPKNDQITPFQQRKDLKKEKDFYVIFFDYKDEFLLCPFSVREECEKFWDIAIKSLSMSKNTKNSYMGKTQMYELNHYSIARIYKNVKQFSISKELFDKLLNETEIYKKETLKP